MNFFTLHFFIITNKSKRVGSAFVRILRLSNMSWIGDSLNSHSKANHIINVFLILTLFISFLLFAINTAQAISNIKNHNITGNITDLECIICHPTQKTQFQSELNQLDKPLLIENTPRASINSLLQVGENYTAILTFGQTPYQLGPFFRSGANGWSWLDSNDWGTEKQKNLILLSILDNTTGSLKPPGIDILANMAAGRF